MFYRDEGISEASSLWELWEINAEFGTADGGCKYLQLAFVFSHSSYMNWYDAIWDAYSPENNTPPKPSDGSRTNDYDNNNNGGYPDTSIRNYCHDDVEDGGYTDWRVPTAGELEAIRTIMATTCSYLIIPSARYWTSTSSLNTAAGIWITPCGGGHFGWCNKNDNYKVICVRKGK